jgi:hypothetical protein
MRKLTKTTTSVSVAAVIAAAGFALQAPVAGAAGEKDAHSGVPGVEMNVGSNASDKGLPGVEMNIGRDGDQNNVDTSTLGAGPDTSESGRPMQIDRN